MYSLAMLEATLMLSKMETGHNSPETPWWIEIHHLHRHQMVDIVSGESKAVYRPR